MRWLGWYGGWVSVFVVCDVVEGVRKSKKKKKEEEEKWLLDKKTYL